MLPKVSEVDTTLTRYVPRYLLLSGHGDVPLRRDFEGVLLMLDIAGFTALTDTYMGDGTAGAERLSAILDRYFGRMTDIALSHGGDVLDIVGDAVLVAWECSDHPETAGLIAVQCGLALQAALPDIVSQTGASLRQRVSVASGALSHFVVGGVDGKWHCLTAGQPLNEAAKANQNGKPHEVVVCPSLWQTIETHCETSMRSDTCVSVSAVRQAAPLPATVTPREGLHPKLLERYVAQPLLERLRMGGGRWLGEFRTITTLFLGFPGIDCASDDALAVLQAAVENTQRVHARVGGTPTRLSFDDKGVTMLSAFGLPLTAREDDAVRAIIAAQALSHSLREYGIAASMGIATGQVFYADSGGSARRHAGLTGAAVNLAARLMVAARAGLLCDDVTRTVAAAGFEFEPRPPVVAKGFAEPVVVWQPGVRLSRERRAFLGMAVGRADELSRMSQALVSVAQQGHAVFALRGEAGIGKSRLIADVATRARERNMHVAWGAGYALEMTSIFFPWRQILAQMLCDTDHFDAVQARTAAASLVADDERWTSWLPLLNDVLPMHWPANDLTQQMTSQARAASLRALMVEFARRLARVRPLLIVADDLHWFDGASASLLLALIGARVPGLMLLLGTRPLPVGQVVPAHEVLAEIGVIDLDALSHADVGSLIVGRLAAVEVAPALTDFVYMRTAGNPFYAEELILALRAARHIDMVDGVVAFAADAASRVTLPDGLRGIIVSRIDALGAAEQLALKIAAVIGREFSLPMLKDLLPPTDASVDLAQVAQVLEREDVVRPARTPGGGYRFKHALLQDTVYEQLPFALRQELHGAVARWIERHEFSDLSPRFAELAQHWELALNIPAAVSYLELAATLSQRRYANREAISLAGRALSLVREHGLPPDAVRDARCQAILGDAHSELFEYRAATEHFTQALASAGHPLPGNRITLLLDLALQLGIQLGTRAGFRSRTSRDPLLPWASHVHEKLGEIAYFDGGVLPLLHATLTSLNLAERSNAVREAVDGLAALAIGFYGAGQHWLSRIYNRRSLALAQEQGGMADIAYANLVSGVYRAAQGHWDMAEQSLTHSVDLYTKLGAVERWQQAFGGLCAIEIMRGRFDHADGWLERLRPHQRDMPVQIAVYLHAFDASIALARGLPLPQSLQRLQGIVAAGELAQFDRVLCQGLIAASSWQLDDRTTAVETALAGLDGLKGGVPAAWYVTDGLAGIAQTLINACALGWVELRQARRACRVLNRYSGATRVAAPRAALMSGHLALLNGDHRSARRHWLRGLNVASLLQMDHDHALLTQALAGLKNRARL